MDGLDFNLDPEKIESATTASTKAIVPMHVAGLMCDMDKMPNRSKEKFVGHEDAAQALLNSREGGAGSFSTAAAFSIP